MLRSEINTLEKFAEHFIAFAEQSAAYCTASAEFSRALGDMRARVSLEPLDAVQFANSTPLFQFWRSLDTSLSTFDLPALTYQEASVIHVDAVAAARVAIAARNGPSPKPHGHDFENVSPLSDSDFNRFWKLIDDNQLENGDRGLTGAEIKAVLSNAWETAYQISLGEP